MTGPKVPLRARFLNKIRRLYRGGALEAFIARKGRSSGSPLWRSLTPGHNLYEPDAIRTFAHDGLEWNVDVSDYIGHGVYFGLDRTTERLFSLAEPDFITFDVGANIGWTALNLARRCPAGQVIAFEPDTRNHRKLVENVRLNSLANLSVERLGAFSPRRANLNEQPDANTGRLDERRGLRYTSPGLVRSDQVPGGGLSCVGGLQAERLARGRGRGT